MADSPLAFRLLLKPLTMNRIRGKPLLVHLGLLCLLARLRLLCAVLLLSGASSRRLYGIPQQG